MDRALKQHLRDSFERRFGKGHDTLQEVQECVERSSARVLSSERARQVAEAAWLDNERANAILDELDACFEPTIKPA